MIYLTYNDHPSGIYSSQVTDVVQYLSNISGKKIRLLALVSTRNFSSSRQKIRSGYPGATVLPMFPKARYWKLNILTLCFYTLLHPSQRIMARGPFATNLALTLKKWRMVKKVIFDARGAYTAELTEYDVVHDKAVVASIKAIEKRALLHADYRLAVSQTLVNYWKETFGYKSTEHVVIPCTLSRHFEFELPSEQDLTELRRQIGFNPNDVLFVYAGSSAGWQSFELVDHYMAQLMTENQNIKLVILSQHFDERYEVVKKFKARIVVTWLRQEEVKNYLLAADYGILYREQSVTNQVASPVKFAEYINCGLKVLISEGLGDYTRFSQEHQCIFAKDDVKRLSYQEKTRIHQLAGKYFLKSNYKDSYLRIATY